MIELKIAILESKLNNHGIVTTSVLTLANISGKLWWVFHSNDLSCYVDDISECQKIAIQNNIPFLDDRIFLMWDDEDTYYPFDEKEFHLAVENLENAIRE